MQRDTIQVFAVRIGRGEYMGVVRDDAHVLNDTFITFPYAKEACQAAYELASDLYPDSYIKKAKTQDLNKAIETQAIAHAIENGYKFINHLN